jgi:hypothetical protein
MKKIHIGILAIVYMAVSSGVAVELHYCMGSKVGMELFGSANEKCGKCGMTEKKTGCCHDEFKFYKLTDSYKNVSNEISFTASWVAVFTDYNIYNWQMPANTALQAVNNNSPPEYTRPDARIMNCVFRI